MPNENIMTITNAYIIFALLVLLAIVGMLFLGNRFKKDKKFSPLAGLATAFIVAGIFFGNNMILGLSLLGVGIVLAGSDIIAKFRSNGRRGKTATVHSRRRTEGR
jgi:drug/metabolite transporter (DMT)-like permease